MNYVQEQAELQTRDYGIYFGQSGYEFVVYEVRTGTWRSVPEDEALGERTLPSGLDFKLVVDARPIVLDETMKEPPTHQSSSDSDYGSTPSSQAHPSAVPHTGSGSSSDSDSGSGSDTDSDSDSQAKAFAPQVMLFSSGDLSSFTITVERPSTGRSITLDENKNGEIIAKPMAGSGGGS
jgi:hypothetical protein